MVLLAAGSAVPPYGRSPCGAQQTPEPDRPDGSCRTLQFGLCITPEGTRRATSEWKKGFYYIALKAELPILLFGLDYGKKRIVCTKKIIPNGNFEEQMKEIKEYFRDFKGKIPENFIV